MTWLRTTGRVSPWSARSEGFTLIEALVALVLVATVCVATLSAVAAATRGRTGLAAHVEAVALADARLAEIATLPADSLATYAAGKGGVFPPPHERFRWSAAVRHIGDPAGLLDVRVVVEWPGGDYSLPTLLYRPPPATP